MLIKADVFVYSLSELLSHGNLNCRLYLSVGLLLCVYELQAGRQTDRQADRQTDRYTLFFTSVLVCVIEGEVVDKTNEKEKEIEK